MDVAGEQSDLDFDVAKSLRYHAYRRSFWDAVDNVSKVLTIISGMSVLVTIVGQATGWAESLAIIVALLSASNIALGFSIRAREHDGLYRSYSRLAQDISDENAPTEVTIRNWRRRRLEIEMDEPSVMDLLERRCSGEEAKARGLTPSPAWKLSPFEIWISQIAFWPTVYHDV